VLAAGFAKFHIRALKGASINIFILSFTAKSPYIRVIQGMLVPAKAILKNTKVSATAATAPATNGARHHL